MSTVPSSTAVSPFQAFSQQPPAQGLYDPAQEHDACGLAVVATLSGAPEHEVVVSALHALRRLEHRGAKGADEGTGDGAGILTHIPDAFFRAVVDFDLPDPHAYVAGTAFLPADDPDGHAQVVEKLAGEEGLRVLGWREVPVRRDIVGDAARETMPVFRQVFLALPEADRETATPSPFPLPGLTGRQFEAPDLLERRAFCLRKRAEHEGVYFPSLSGRTIVYKGMLTTAQLEPFYPDLTDERFATRVATVHQRFSTNTFPSWPLAQPFRIIAHNGEINTVKGNRNWMRARESQIASRLLAGPHGEDISRIFPICAPGGSDSASFDEVLELLNMSGRTLPQAVMMMIPEAWESSPQMDPARRAFYEYNSMVMEPWDGPACMTFTDGRLAGAVLDRNGLRPGRYIVTEDGLVVLASEVGVIDVDPAKVVRRGRLAPGKMFLVDTIAGRIVEDEEIKAAVAGSAPYQEWLDQGRFNLGDLPPREHIVHTRSSVTRRQRTFGYTEEELRVLVTPMAQKGAEPLGAMGSDTPLAAFTERSRLLFDYFVQTFAQVTNPPLDAIREELVTSLAGALGPEGNLLLQTPGQAHRLILPYPVIDNDDLAKIVHIDAGLYDPEPGRATVTLRGLYRVESGGAGLAARLEELAAEADAAIADGAKFLVLSDRDSDAEWAPIPSLLLVGAIHHHLIREKTRTRVSLIVEAGDVREVHHVATLIGYGATAVNPYLAMESVEDLVRTGMVTDLDADEAVHNFLHALGKGVLKIMSKMGISTVASYCGAQTFEALGLGKDVVEAYFTGTTTQLGGIGLDTIAAEVADRHQHAYPSDGQHLPHRRLEIGGEYKWRREGPPHLFNPETVFRLQHSTRTGRYDIFKQYTRLVDDQSEQLMTLRGLLKFGTGRTPVPIEEVEPVESIVTRFATGAMSYGSISMEAHSTLARAMNLLGGKSNTGEGGEDPERLLDPEIRSAVKQVASGRFGVTSLYLTHADDLQIKMAQGAKPGEGGQLPSGKVYPWIARTRHATPGVGLISPPPHHDIYSIEDLAQLIYDLKRANPKARIHVKLVSEVGVGTVAAGVAKAKADVVLISGNDGGTGAAPLNSLKHTGAPWELGLAEAQQTLMLNNMRDRIVVQCDGQLKTGRDVVIAALLGAEEFGFATAPLVVEGCIMMRACHLDTCPVGVATQNPELRARFSGKAEYVVNFMRFIAEEVREYLAQLGFRSIEEAVGHTEVLDTTDAEQYWKASGLDLSPILHGPEFPDSAPRSCTRGQDHELDRHFDHRLIRAAGPVFESRKPVHVSADITNVDRSVGTLLGHEITERFGTAPLPDNTIDVTLTGSAGQSLGAFMPKGITLRLFGDANDYVAKGLSGGRVIVRPDHRSSVPAARNVIAGNVIGYGATSGELFISGIVGERFLVRNSGATAVVEGIGDHGCEYMTGGIAMVLGPTGRNFAAGMSGGIAYVLDLDQGLLNHQAVAAGELTLSPLDPDDISTVGTLLRRHRDETGSMLATDLLAELDITIGRLTKVVPTDYAAVLTARDEAALAGLDPDGPEAWQQILEVTHG